MLRTFVIGAADAGPHLAALLRARALPESQRLFSDAPVVVHGGQHGPDVVPVASLDEAASLLDPDGTVVHVSSWPAAPLLSQLADLGFHLVVVEQPLAPTVAGLDEVQRLVAEHGLRLAVFAPWLASALTARLHDLVLGGTLGALRSVSVVQRRSRAARAPGLTAFDVDVPHAVGVALRLAGAAEVARAGCTDLVPDVGAVVPRMGSARLQLRHVSGVHTEIDSDLASPERMRRIELRFDAGAAVGGYPVSADDPHAQLLVSDDGHERHAVFHDDALASFVLRVYDGFLGEDLGLHADVVRLLCAAKELDLRPTFA
jgi:predicted dehydrogenase